MSSDYAMVESGQWLLISGDLNHFPWTDNSILDAGAIFASGRFSRVESVDRLMQSDAEGKT
jgi:hypothetical protein